MKNIVLISLLITSVFAAIQNVRKENEKGENKHDQLFENLTDKMNSLQKYSNKFASNYKQYLINLVHANKQNTIGEDSEGKNKLNKIEDIEKLATETEKVMRQLIKNLKSKVEEKDKVNTENEGSGGGKENEEDKNEGRGGEEGNEKDKNEGNGGSGMEEENEGNKNEGSGGKEGKVGDKDEENRSGGSGNERKEWSDYVAQLYDNSNDNEVEEANTKEEEEKLTALLMDQ